MRVDKCLANMGYGSRKDVKQLLKKGHVKINEKMAKDPKQHVDPDKDAIFVNNEQVIYQVFAYFMMNKPKGVITATEDAKQKTVMDLLNSSDQRPKLFPVGRLDKDTEGLILITNDGSLAHYLLSPKHHVKKTYYAKVDGRVTDRDIEIFNKGIVLDDGYKALPAQLTILKSDNISDIEITIMEGKFHQIKRMFQAVDKRVIDLKRLKMGSLQLDPLLAPGAYRALSSEEITTLTAHKV
ncbi:ribosomal small subunit pseudouridine synthase A [Scopulibacillus darangshiensis]|uniref:Pseudouridine synthase n=1 Tax=Scopulibacillus darangshiensis TaxID=442528 RepID=A0A4R2NX09_9BACL|nr:pseudouridine synthase [Scopulibacillus darangshiensis]TCP26650.1 ribosomal small subunit pseudouridine synthase A [Scopulibacillus darangshiensis]